MKLFTMYIILTHKVTREQKQELQLQFLCQAAAHFPYLAR